MNRLRLRFESKTNKNISIIEFERQISNSAYRIAIDNREIEEL